MALIAPHKLKKLAIETTAVVVPDHVTIVPMQSDKMNCAKNTMLLTMAISVPNPVNKNRTLDGFHSMHFFFSFVILFFFSLHFIYIITEAISNFYYM